MIEKIHNLNKITRTRPQLKKNGAYFQNFLIIYAPFNITFNTLHLYIFNKCNNCRNSVI